MLGLIGLCIEMKEKAQTLFCQKKGSQFRAYGVGYV